MRNLLLASLLLVACGTDSDNGMGSGADAGIDAGSDAGYVPLITGDWQLADGMEKYVCVRQTFYTDMYIKAIQPIAPLGTHHEVLMLGPPDKKDGIEDCDSSLVKPSIYAAGLGVQPLVFPDGIAIHIKPGDQLLLNLHLFNATGAPLSGTSGMQVIPTDASAVQHEVGVVLAGKGAGLEVDLGQTQQTGTCTTPADTTMIAVAPHMHLLGTHMTVTYNGASVIDTDYNFDLQHYTMLAPITTVAGGKYTVTCSYDNETGNIVYFGEHTTDEMCFALTFVYPAPTGSDQCTK